jgi:alkylation response protein AidB-like acyl-CoA dehydrogenase
VLTPAWLEPGNGYGPAGVQVRAERKGKAFVISGRKLHVHFASSAAALIVLARTGKREEDVSLFIVDPADPGVSYEQQRTLAADTQYAVTFDGVRVPASACISEKGNGWAVWNEIMHDGIILCAAQAVGGAQRALEITVQYSKDRHQFGKPLGAFQALAHYMADGQTLVDGGTTLVYEAAWTRAAGRPVERLAPMAKLFACQTYRDVTAMCEQVHGGMGFTIEYDIQLFFRRAKQLQLSWWDTRYLEELVARSVLDETAA